MKHYAMTTKEAFKAASAISTEVVDDTDARVDDEDALNVVGGSICGSISSPSGDICQISDEQPTPDSHGETGVEIVRDSAGDYYLVGRAGLEPKRKKTTTPANSEFVNAQDNAESSLLPIFELLKTLSVEQVEQLETAIKNLKSPNFCQANPGGNGERKDR